MPRSVITAALSGFIFGVGLSLAGMLNPSKVSGFLDIFGLWDPSLAFVMAGGISVNAAGYFLFARRGRLGSHLSFTFQRLPILTCLLLWEARCLELAGACRPMSRACVSSLFLNPAEMFFF